MITDGTNKFTRYALFTIAFSATMFAVDQYLVLHPNVEVSHESRPMKSYGGKIRANTNEKETPKVEEKQVVNFTEPKFKKQVKIDPKFKKINQDSTLVVIEEPEQKTAPISKPESSATYFENLTKDYQARVIDKMGSDKHRKDVIVRYYTHTPDGQKVYALQKLGFYIHERPVEDPLDSYESNAIFYGDQVKKEDLQLVIYTLLKQGLPIKKITPSLFHDSWKSSSIEIGTDTTANKKKQITLEELQQIEL
jgi:hypothetical protein